MTSLLVFIFILGLLIVIHECGHFIAARRQGIMVEKFYLGFGPVVYKRKRGETEYGISMIPLGGYVKLAGDSAGEHTGGQREYLSKTPFQRMQVIFAGPLANYVLGFLFFWLIFATGYPTLTAKVGGLVEGFGAEKAGVRAGDVITHIDGRAVATWEDLQETVRSRQGAETLLISLTRGGQEIQLSVPLRQEQMNDILGYRRTVSLLGVTPDTEEVIEVRHGAAASFVFAARKVVDLTVLNYRALFSMISGRLSVRESATGPLGIFFVTSKAAKMGLTAVLHLIAVLNVSLAIFNLLPLPVLDGGHLVFLMIEKLRGKSLSVRAEQIISQAGLALIISLALLVTYNDILRFFGDRFSQLLK